MARGATARLNSAAKALTAACLYARVVITWPVSIRSCVGLSVISLDRFKAILVIARIFFPSNRKEICKHPGFHFICPTPAVAAVAPNLLIGKDAEIFVAAPPRSGAMVVSKNMDIAHLTSPDFPQQLRILDACSCVVLQETANRLVRPAPENLGKLRERMVLLERIELSTSPLPR